VRVLVDSTVWIDFLRNVNNRQTALLERLIRERHDLCLCGFVLTEVLQGIRDERQYVATKRQCEDLIYLGDDKSTYELAATMYRELRKREITVRNSIDCLIASVVVQHGVRFLERDRDYHQIDQHYPLQRL
jgi:predicted nucleic acid-binding protein